MYWITNVLVIVIVTSNLKRHGNLNTKTWKTPDEFNTLVLKAFIRLFDITYRQYVAIYKVLQNVIGK